MYISSIGMINNASFGAMQDNNALMNLTRSAGSQSGGDAKSMQQAEKKLVADQKQNELTYNAANLMEDSQKKVEKENIKRSFSAFA